MNGHTLKDRIVFFDLQPIWRVLFILGGNVPGSTWLARFLMLCAFQNYLNPISFLCHCIVLKRLDYLLFGIDFLQYSRDSFFVDDLQSPWWNIQGHPTIFFWNVKSLFGNIYIKSPFGLIDGEGNIVSKHHLFSCNFTNFGHLPNYLSDFIEAANLYHFAGTYKILFQNFKISFQSSSNALFTDFSTTLSRRFPILNCCAKVCSGVLIAI